MSETRSWQEKRRRTHGNTVTDHGREVRRVSSNGVAADTSGDTDVTLLRGVEVEDRELIGGDLELIDLSGCKTKLLDDLGNRRCVKTRGECGASKCEEAGSDGGGEHGRRERKS